MLRRAFVVRSFAALLLLTFSANGPLRAQSKPAQQSKPDDRTNGVVHSLNGVKGDVTLQGDGGLVVSQQGTTITVSAPTALGVGRSEPDPKYALDVGGTGVMRIGNSIFLDGNDNTVTASTGTISFRDSNVTTSGVISGNGAGLTNVSFGSLIGGSNGAIFVAPNPANQFGGSFTGAFTGNLNGAAASANTAATATIANNLAGGTFSNLYHFTNAGNTFRGAFTGDGSGLTGITTSGLASGAYGNVYQFNNAANAFTGTFSGNLTGNASTATTATNATNATTAVIANNLAGGSFGNLYQFTNTGNTYQGTFLGTFSGNATSATTATTADTANTLAAGEHAAAYQFTNPSNAFAGAFTGNLNGNATSATTATTATNATNATTAATATTLAGGVHAAQYTFDHSGNAFSGTFTGTFSGDGSQLAGVTDDARVAKAGDTMSGLLILSASGLQFADGTTMMTSATPQGWSLDGNTGLTADHFVGTTDNSALQLRVRGFNAFRIVPSQNFFGGSDGDAPNLIGGSNFNDISTTHFGSAIAGGGEPGMPNHIIANFGAVGGGRSNFVGSDFSVVAGGDRNMAGVDAFLATTDFHFATVSGGSENRAGGTGATVAGGMNNVALGLTSSVAGGVGNVANGQSAAAAGGQGNTAHGDLSFVAGGFNNIAEGTGSFAAGTAAHAFHDRSFVFNNATAGAQSEHQGQFLVRATGGVKFLTNDGAGQAGVELAPGSGSWSTASDKNAKKNLEPIDGESVLRAVAGLPIWRWSYTTQADDVRHMGPTSQDFRTAFGLGENDTTISVVDADGVNLAAVQALEKRTSKLQEENALLRSEIERLRVMQQQMMYRLEELMRQRR